MMQPIPITDPRVENYLYAVLPARNAVLQQMELQAKERDIPIVGPAVGRLLFQYARLINARTIFEMGSAIGYSTIWWAMAVGEGGNVHYADGSEKMRKRRTDIFSRPASPIASKCVGDALTLSKAQEQFDIAFAMSTSRIIRGADAWLPPRAQGGFSSPTTPYGRAMRTWRKSRLTPDPADAATNAVAELNRMLYASPDWSRPSFRCVMA